MGLRSLLLELPKHAVDLLVGTIVSIRRPAPRASPQIVEKSEHYQGHHAEKDAHGEAHAHEREVKHDLHERSHCLVALVHALTLLEVEGYAANHKDAY